MNCSMPGFLVHHQLSELAQTHVHWVGDAIQSSHPLSSPSPAAFNLSIRVFSNESVLHIRQPKYWSLLGLQNYCSPKLSDFSHKIKRHLLRGRKALTNLDNILKSRDITLLTKVYTVRAMVFPEVMYRCKSWIIKKAETQRIDALNCGAAELLSVPWTARSNQSCLKEVNPQYSLEGLMLKLQYLATWGEEQTHWKRPWCWERLKAKK